ncbi:hypothetical protein JD844_021072, partial [Phrynosoma platyrhinos]
MEQNSEQRASSVPIYLNLQSSSARSQPRREQATLANNELIKPPDQSKASLRVVQTASAQSLHQNNPAISCTDEKLSTAENQGGKIMPDHENPFHVTADLDKEKDIAFLLKELDVLRANNKKLQDKLSEKDKELKTIKLDLELHERVTEAKIAEKAAGMIDERSTDVHMAQTIRLVAVWRGLMNIRLYLLFMKQNLVHNDSVVRTVGIFILIEVTFVQEVHFAQRERDDAIMARLKLANEERDDAWKRIKSLEQSFEMLENINPEENDMTLQELLNRINNADTGLAIRRSGAVIVDRIYRIQERKKKITAEEMNAVIEERDAAVAQVIQFTEENHRNHLTTPPTFPFAVQKAFKHSRHRRASISQ